MTCDHGIRLDRYCGDCESGFTFPTEVSDPHAWARDATVAAYLLAFALALYLIVTRWPR